MKRGPDESPQKLCDRAFSGPRTATIGGLAIDARLMAEDCQNLDQQFLNLYWVSSANNQIVQSRQWLGDFIGVVNTRVIPRS
ncbi:MAG: hypothetical protein COB16_17500 [Rhodobacteraceae bacterium]|nr:MAG: hypothetical protein COB16_17500 [Paracoccaceae bacterium]